MAHGFLRRLFEVFERYRTAVDVVTTSEVSVSVTIDDSRRLTDIVAALSEFAEVNVEPDMAILCAVGDNLRLGPGVRDPDARRARRRAAADGVAGGVAPERHGRAARRDVAAAMSRLHDAWFAATTESSVGSDAVTAGSPPLRLLLVGHGRMGQPGRGARRRARVRGGRPRRRAQRRRPTTAGRRPTSPSISRSRRRRAGERRRAWRSAARTS